MVKRLFIVGLLAAALWLAYKHLSTRDYSGESVAAANSVNEILLALGARDSDIAGQFRRQMSSGRARWIEFHKRLRLPFDDKAAAALDNLASRAGFDIEKEQTPDGYSVKIKSGGRTYCSLVFMWKKQPAERSSAAPEGPRAAIVIDDVGYNLKDLEEFLALGVPLTYAVLPRERNSKSAAELLGRRGADFLVHFPMEPDDPLVNPGRAAVTTAMDEKEIASRFEAAVKTVPGAFGISNHMGSKFTRSRKHMEIFLKLAADAGMVYFDSHTSAKSVAASAARELKVPVAVNQIFLDNDDSREAIDGQLALLLKKARARPPAIAIGHVHKKNLPPAIKDFLPRFEEAGVRLVSLKEIYAGPAAGR